MADECALGTRCRARGGPLDAGCRVNPASAPSLLEIKGLGWQHAGRWIVHDVDLRVRSGEIVGLLGPNGAGKTVTLSMIAGLLRPTTGRVLLDGCELTHLPLHLRARSGVGYLPQERSVFTHLSAQDNIAAILESRGMRGRAARAKAATLLDEFGLTAVAHTAAIRLSGGEQRRLEVARSLATDPRFLLFDEPFAGIDPLTIESLHALLVGLRGRGVGVLLTDHNVRETLSLCDRAYVLLDGGILAQGDARAVTGDPRVRAHFLGETFDLVDAELASTLG